MNQCCVACGETFEIPAADLAFLDRMAPSFAGEVFSIPPPTHCPLCRWQRRLAFRNERRLYKRKCDLTGKQMISMHAADAPFPVYYISDWLGDKWDARSYGRDFDFGRPFFEQFAELARVVPRFSLFVDPTMDENSEYTNCASESKNCYLISQAEKNQDCYHSRGINNCRDCCDCLRVNDCELCYECINASRCYRCSFVQDCDSCSECFFSSDLRGCQYCFGCHGLQQKQFYMFNEPLSRGEWERRIKNIAFTAEVIEEFQKKSEALRLKTPQRFAHILQCEDSTGDHLLECRDARDCFDSKGLEHCAYCFEVLNGAQYCQDFSMFGLNCELLYECNGCGYNVYHVLFANHCWQNVSELYYCESCFPSVKNCFGCVGLQWQEYCILNKQYSKEEYIVLAARILRHMKETGEWGEFFPLHFSPFAYNESLAGQFFPLTKEAVKEKGWRWLEDTESAGSGRLPQVPATIEETAEEITDEVLMCESTRKLYRITKAELQFYRKIGVPVPRKHPEERYRLRFEKRNPRRTWPRKCEKCGSDLRTSFPFDSPHIVYCERCYLESVGS